MTSSITTSYIRTDALDNAKLGSLVEHLSTYNVSAKRIPPDMLGEDYMDLVRHFAPRRWA